MVSLRSSDKGGADSSSAEAMASSAAAACASGRAIERHHAAAGGNERGNTDGERGIARIGAQNRPQQPGQVEAGPHGRQRQHGSRNQPFGDRQLPHALSSRRKRGAPGARFPVFL
ncbi:MAG: hypothetical protein P8Y53_15130 [Pseudolabrys sp.]